jgi:(p)ppGpp synthase/HD superfamily hydrolase
MALSPRFDEALLLAAKLHRDQLRKGSQIPYLAHLLAVAAIALEYGASEDQAVAALLHDAVEDQGGLATLALIRDCFGDGVAEIVRSCSDADSIPKSPWRARKEAYVAHLAQAPEAAWLVSAADKLHNARAIVADYRQIGEPVFGRFQGGKQGTLWYYQSLVGALLGRVPAGLHQELARVVGELVSLAEGVPAPATETPAGPGSGDAAVAVGPGPGPGS